MAKATKIDAKNKIKDYTQRFFSAQKAVLAKQKTWKMLDIYDRGEQWKDANVPPWVAKPVTNYVRYIRTLKRANLAASIPLTHLTPLRIEYAKFTERLQKAYEHVWHWEKVERTARWCIDRGTLFGTALAYVHEDTTYVGGTYQAQNIPDKLFQGKICVKYFPLYNFFIDPDAYCIYEAKYIETTEVISLRSIKNNPTFKKYCKENGSLKKLQELNSDQLESDDSAEGTFFNRDSKPNQPDARLDEDSMATLHTHWERYLNDDGKWQLDVSYYLRNTDFFLYRIEDVKPNCYPFAVYKDEEEDNQFHGTSNIQDIIENQKVINKTSQTYSIIATMHQNPQKVVTRTSGINAQEVALTGTVPGKVWTSNEDATKSIQYIQPPEIPRGLFEVENNMKQDIREISGINEAYTGQSVGSLTTSTGVRSLIDRASIRDKDKMKQIDAFVEDLSDIIIKMILHRWQDDRPTPVRQPDGSTQMNTYQPIPKDIADQLEWMCTCDTYSVAPSTEESRRQEVKELLDIQGKYQFSPAIITPQEAIKRGNYQEKELILARMQKDLEMQQQQMAQQPPKIAPNGEISFNLSSKDPSVVLDTLQQLMQEAQVQQQQQMALTAAHLNNGLNVTPNRPDMQGQTPDGATLPNGSADAQAMAAMTGGQ